MISSWSPASWTSSTRQSTQARQPSMTGAPVTGAGCQATPTNLSPPETANPWHSSRWWSPSTLTQKLARPGDPWPAGRGAGRGHGHEGGIDGQRDEALTGEADRLALLHAGHDGDAGGEPAHGVLETVGRRRLTVRPCPGRPMIPSAAACTSSLWSSAATRRAWLSIRSTCLSVWAGSWWNRIRRRAPASPGHPDGVGLGRVAPLGHGHELLVGVLGVVDDQVGAVTQLEDLLVHRSSGRPGPGGRRCRPDRARRPRCG